MYFLDGSVPTPEIAEKFIEVCEQERGCIAGIISVHTCVCAYIYIFISVCEFHRSVCVCEREREKESRATLEERKSDRATEQESDRATKRQSDRAKERGGECVCVCVCVREREREKEREAHTHTYTHTGKQICVYVFCCGAFRCVPVEIHPRVCV